MRDAVPMSFVRFEDSIPEYDDLYHVWEESMSRSWDDSGPITLDTYYAYLLMESGVEHLDNEPIRAAPSAHRIPTLGWYRKGHSRRHPKHATLRDHRMAA